MVVNSLKGLQERSVCNCSVVSVIILFKFEEAYSFMQTSGKQLLLRCKKI